MTIAYTSAKRAVYQFDLAVFKILTDWDISLDPFGNKHFSTAWTTLDFLMDFRLNKSGLFDFYDAVIYSVRIVASLCIPIIGIVFVNDEFSAFSVLSTSTAISNAHLVTSLIRVLVIIILRILIIVEIIVVVIVEIVSVNVILGNIFVLGFARF